MKAPLPGPPKRDLALAAAISQLDDAALIGLRELAAFLGLSEATLKRPETRNKLGLSEPLPGCRHLRWRLGTVRALGGNAGAPKIGRPSKAVQMARAVDPNRQQHT